MPYFRDLSQSIATKMGIIATKMGIIATKMGIIATLDIKQLLRYNYNK